MNDPHESQESNTYDHWKAITESDFVTLFIKTWFAFVATLRRMYPKDIPYYEAAGDYPIYVITEVILLRSSISFVFMAISKKICIMFTSMAWK